MGGTFSPYFTHAGPIMPAIMGPDPAGVTSPLGMVQQTVVTQQKMPRSDRLEVSYLSLLLVIHSRLRLPQNTRLFNLLVKRSAITVFSG